MPYQGCGRFIYLKRQKTFMMKGTSRNIVAFSIGGIIQVNLAKGLRRHHLDESHRRDRQLQRRLQVTHLKLDDLTTRSGGLAIFGVFRRHFLRGKSEEGTKRCCDLIPRCFRALSRGCVLSPHSRVVHRSCARCCAPTRMLRPRFPNERLLVTNYG